MRAFIILLLFIDLESREIFQKLERLKQIKMQKIDFIINSRNIKRKDFSFLDISFLDSSPEVIVKTRINKKDIKLAPLKPSKKEDKSKAILPPKSIKVNAIFNLAFLYKNKWLKAGDLIKFKNISYTIIKIDKNLVFIKKDNKTFKILLQLLKVENGY